MTNHLYIVTVSDLYSKPFSKEVQALSAEAAVKKVTKMLKEVYSKGRVVVKKIPVLRILARQIDSCECFVFSYKTGGGLEFVKRESIVLNF